MIITANIATIFGTKVSVCSWIEVVVWNMDMMSPTSIPTPISGADTIRITMSDSRIIVITVTSVMPVPRYLNDRTSS